MLDNLDSSNDSERSSPSVKEETRYDVVCVGFGPAALSLAIAIHEQSQLFRVLFLERLPEFSWRGEKFPNGSSSMKTTLLQDLVAQRNPISKFTFINYLWSTENLVSFTNLGVTHPPRKVFAQYLHWCAKHINDLGWVQYNQKAEAIEPAVQRGNTIDLWRIKIKDMATGKLHSILADKVLVAVGTQPKLPHCLHNAAVDGRILHSSDFLECVPRLVAWPGQTLDIAIFGENDEAVEVFEYCRELRWKGYATFFVGDVALRQTDNNPL
jgi:L-ornithine N5-oxygenase